MAYFSIRLVIVLVATCAAFAQASGKSNVEPQLKPKANKAFLKDMLSDRSPRADEHYYFDHPYPAVMDSGDYDKDFTKDENGDGGKWDAQMKYDILRNRISGEHKRLSEMETNLATQSEVLSATRTKEKAAEEATNAADKEADEAKKELKDAEEDVDNFGGKSGKGGRLGEQEEVLDDEVSDLEGCRKKLAEAKEKLKKALAEQKDMEEVAKKQEKEREEAKAEEKEERDATKKERDEKKKKDNEAKAAAKAEAKAKKQKEVDEKKKKGDSEKNDAEDAVKDAESAVKKSQDELSAAEAKHEREQKSYEEQLNDVKKTEDDLARAAAKLHKFRQADIDQDGGVYYKEVKKSGTPAKAPVSMGLLAGVAIVLLSGSA